MDDSTLQQVVQQHGISLLGQHHHHQAIPEQHAPSSLLQSLPLHVSFDHGYFLTVRAIQELRDKKQCPVAVGIGGPSGSGKSSLAARIASVLAGVVICMDHYYDPQLVDDNFDLEALDFELLLQNLEDLLRGHDTRVPTFDFHEKKRTGFKTLKAPISRVVIVDGTYALHSKLRSVLDIRVAVVGGVHFSLMSKVRRDIGDTLSLDSLLESIFPTFKAKIEPDLHHAQIRISNTFVSSLREPYYILKCEKQAIQTSLEFLFNSSKVRHEQYIEMYLRPPSMYESTTKSNDWIRMRQFGIRYDLAEIDQRIVDKHFIIKPKVEFEVGKLTLGGLLAVGYQVAVSFKRESDILENDKVTISLETIDDLEKTFVHIKGTDRKVVTAEAARLGLEGQWITKSYMEMVLEKKGPPRMDSPPLPSSAFLTSVSSPTSLLTAMERNFSSPQPVRVTPEKVSSTVDMWTRSPTKSENEPLSGSWHITTGSGMSFRGDPYPEAYFQPDTQEPFETSPRDFMRLLPRPDVFDFDRGLLLAVQAVQTLLNTKGPPIIVGIGGPSGSGKTSLAHKMANIVGCEVISMENYFKTEELKEFKYDDFSTLDLTLLLKNIKDAKTMRPTRVPVFDFKRNVRSGTKKLEVSDECGIVIVEGVYALHPDIRAFLDMSIAVVGGVHSHLVTRVVRDLEQCGRPTSRQDVMTTVFPMFQQHIEPHLRHAHLKICNDFDPVHSPESSMFVLKSSKQVPLEQIFKVLDRDRTTKIVQSFIDIYFHLPVLPSAISQFSESKWIRVRNCEGRFALLIREPIREGDFIIQPRVDFDISVRTVAGLLTLGYQAVAYIEATATIYQDDKLLIELDELKNISTPYIQIKGSNKEVVSAAGHTLNLEGHYTTSPYIEIILANGLMSGEGMMSGVQEAQAAKLQELVDFVQAQDEAMSYFDLQGGNANSDTLASPALSVEGVLDGFDARLKRLERWQMINTVLWTFFVSAFIGYVLYQRSARRPRW